MRAEEPKIGAAFKVAWIPGIQEGLYNNYYLILLFYHTAQWRGQKWQTSKTNQSFLTFEKTARNFRLSDSDCQHSKLSV